MQLIECGGDLLHMPWLPRRRPVRPFHVLEREHREVGKVRDVPDHRLNGEVLVDERLVGELLPGEICQRVLDEEGLAGRQDTAIRPRPGVASAAAERETHRATECFCQRTGDVIDHACARGVQGGFCRTHGYALLVGRPEHERRWGTTGRGHRRQETPALVHGEIFGRRAFRTCFSSMGVYSIMGGGSGSRYQSTPGQLP